MTINASLHSRIYSLETCKDSHRACSGIHGKRTTVSTVECISADDEFFKTMIIWHPHRLIEPIWPRISSWAGTISIPIVAIPFPISVYSGWKLVFDPQTKGCANGKPRVLICDGFGMHLTLEILEHPSLLHFPSLFSQASIFGCLLFRTR